MADERSVYTRDAQVGSDLTQGGIALIGAEGDKKPQTQEPALRLHRSPPEILRRIPLSLAKEKKILPLGVKDGVVQLASLSALSQPDVAALQLRIGGPIHVVRVSDEEALLEAIDSNYQHVVEIDSAPAQAPSEQTVRLATTIIEQAVKVRASDVHFQPHAKGLDIRFRIDGVLNTAATLNLKQANGLITYLKVLADLDYSQRGKPLDGHITRRVAGREVDLRFSSIGTAVGLDKIVLRVLDRRRSLLKMRDLGFTKESEELFRELLDQKQGIILVAGPTGHGKTTTLNSAVLEIDAIEQNIVTLEDPVEYILPKITQIPVSSSSKEGSVTFASGLRAVLRQDPDVIVVGEMRDADTVEIAVQAALSGHLVLSSIHAIDAVATVFRLLERGVEPYMLAASLTGVLSQRLLRRVCPHCIVHEAPTDAERAYLEQYAPDREVPNALPHGTGCNRCNNTGYLGRESLYEVLPITDELRGMIVRQNSPHEIRSFALGRGFRPMRATAAEKVLDGRTTVAEVARVLAEKEMI